MTLVIEYLTSLSHSVLVLPLCTESKSDLDNFGLDSMAVLKGVSEVSLVCIIEYCCVVY